MTHNSPAVCQPWTQLVCLMVIGGLLAGCAADKKLHYLGGDRELNYYEDQATKIEYPLSDDPTPENVAFSQPPRMISDRDYVDIWQMPLTEAIHLALVNNKIIRAAIPGGPGNSTAGSQILTNPDFVASVYDPAIRESGILFGGRGVESALSQFDTQLTTRMQWNAASSVQNNAFFGNLPAGSTLDQDGATFSTDLNKQMPYGATFDLVHNINYTRNNQPARFFHSAYDGNVQLNYRQPLLAGAGSEFTHIAGPIGTNIQGVSGVNQGVWIARINTDISLVDFEANVRNMLLDVEKQYWDLYFGYRAFHASIVRRNSALRTWREVYAKFIGGAKGGGAAEEAQARANYYDARAQSENARQTLYSAEIQLRRLCGLSVSDGRMIQPADEPVTAEYVPEWHLCLAEALTRREEIRRQKWNIKSFELQYDAAKNLARPRFDFVSSYQINGFGDDLFNHDGPDPETASADRFQSFYRSMTRASQDGWTTGFEFSLPLGLRNALSQMRNQELRLVKARDVLAAQELEVSHQLAVGFQTLAFNYTTAQTQFNRMRAAQRQTEAIDAAYKAGTQTLDLLLRAQTELSVAESAYYSSIVAYNKEIANIHFLKGTLLSNYNVNLSEGLWTPEAYRDALRRAWARTYAIDIPPTDPVYQSPDNVSTGIPVHPETQVLGEGSDPLLLDRATPEMEQPGLAPQPGTEVPAVPPAEAPPINAPQSPRASTTAADTSLEPLPPTASAKPLAEDVPAEQLSPEPQPQRRRQ